MCWNGTNCQMNKLKSPEEATGEKLGLSFSSIFAKLFQIANNKTMTDHHHTNTAKAFGELRHRTRLNLMADRCQEKALDDRPCNKVWHFTIPRALPLAEHLWHTKRSSCTVCCPTVWKHTSHRWTAFLRPAMFNPPSLGSNTFLALCKVEKNYQCSRIEDVNQMKIKR